MNDCVNATSRVVVRPATENNFADLRAVLEPKSCGPQGCWCLAYRLTNAENSTLRGERRPERVLELCKQRPGPGLLAYLADEPVGWCAVGPWNSFKRLERSKTIPKPDEPLTWSVVCLVVRSGFRRQGVARALVVASVDHAARAGASSIEGYPIDTGGTRVSTTLAYVGTTSMFSAAGFTRVAQTSSRSAGLHRVIMRRTL